MKSTLTWGRAFVARASRTSSLQSLFAGALMPLGFAPFHFPGLAILGIALLFAQLNQRNFKIAFLPGFLFGLMYMGLGTSWIYISIHDYGHIHALIAGGITLLFMMYLAVFFGLMTHLYAYLSKNNTSSVQLCLLWSALWCLCEYVRGNFLGGFPWLSLGFGQIDTPLKNLLPIVGVYGVSYLTCLSASILVIAMQKKSWHSLWLYSFVFIIVGPILLNTTQWSVISPKTLSVGVIQANLSMREKWNAQLFWSLLNQYDRTIRSLITKKQLIILPESAIPVPENYIQEWLSPLKQLAQQENSAILLGIPQATTPEETSYYNTISTLGHATGIYLKQHLVPFGEFIPKPFASLMTKFNIPMNTMTAGGINQKAVRVHGYSIATLICYELAYPELLRQQTQKSAFIISVSDDGWFGKSLAVYQQLQMAQVLSMESARFQIMANNDGLSSVINTKGEIIESLPAFQSGVLETAIYPAMGMSPWAYWGDLPIIIISLLSALIIFLKKYRLPLL